MPQSDDFGGKNSHETDRDGASLCRIFSRPLISRKSAACDPEEDAFWTTTKKIIFLADSSTVHNDV